MGRWQRSSRAWRLGPSPWPWSSFSRLASRREREAMPNGHEVLFVRSLWARGEGQGPLYGPLPPGATRNPATVPWSRSWAERLRAFRAAQGSPSLHLRGLRPSRQRQGPLCGASRPASPRAATRAHRRSQKVVVAYREHVVARRTAPTALRAYPHLRTGKVQIDGRLHGSTTAPRRL
jgi:hypothetical protein